MIKLTNKNEEAISLLQERVNKLSFQEYQLHERIEILKATIKDLKKGDD